MSKCLIYKQRFVPSFFNQKVCSLLDCKQTYAVILLGQIRKANEKEYKRQIQKESFIKRIYNKIINYFK